MSEEVIGQENFSNPEDAKTVQRTMPADHVVGIYNLLESHGIKIWVDGGWGVDALLEEQTREHGDLDIAIQERDLYQMRELLGERGYHDKGEQHARPWNFIIQDQSGHEIDVHAINLDIAGNGIYGPEENGVMYPASSLTGSGQLPVGECAAFARTTWLSSTQVTNSPRVISMTFWHCVKNSGLRCLHEYRK